MTPRRWYLIRGAEGSPVALVEAASSAQALAHVARNLFRVAVATPGDTIAAMRANVTPQRAGEQPAGDETATERETIAPVARPVHSQD